MKTFMILRTGFMSALIVMSLSLFSQEQGDCKVLKEEISGSYTGKCKNGLAHGKGIARGIDEYNGSFKKGYPHGSGKYTYADGSVYEGAFSEGKRSGTGMYTFSIDGKDSVQNGIWKDDKYVKALPVKPYEIKTQRNISRYSLTKMSDSGNKVTITISRGGVSLYPNDLSLIGSSGSTMHFTTYAGFDQVTFPFTGLVKYSMSNQMSDAKFLVEFEFVIKEPGDWEVKLNH